MSGNPRIVVTVNADGLVGAETIDILGDRCLDYIAVLEDLIGGTVQSSSYTADHARTADTVQDRQVNRDVDRA
jgi:hypothetical protein